MSKENEIDPRIAERAFYHLRMAGFEGDDPSLVGIFDLSMIRVAETGQILVPPSFINSARAAHPKLFFDAMTASKEEIDARIKGAAREAAKAKVASETENLLAKLRQQYQ
jgi:hypothetical protein